MDNINRQEPAGRDIGAVNPWIVYSQYLEEKSGEGWLPIQTAAYTGSTSNRNCLVITMILGATRRVFFERDINFGHPGNLRNVLLSLVALF